MKNTQKGFGLVPVLLILILLSVVGFAGYYVYDKQSSKKIDSSAAVAGDTTVKSSPTPIASPTTKATATPTVAATPSPNSQKYLVINEWGVKIPIDDRTGSASYSIKNNAYSGDGKNYNTDVATIAFKNIRCVPITLMRSDNGFQDTPGGMGPYYYKIQIGSGYYQGALPLGPIDSSCNQEGLADTNGLTFTGNYEYIGNLLTKLQSN